MAFAITTLDGEQITVDEADAYQLEGPFTTFFVADGGHGKISSWSLRVASLRTEHIAAIRLVELPATVRGGAEPDVVSLRAV